MPHDDGPIFHKKSLILDREVKSRARHLPLMLGMKGQWRLWRARRWARRIQSAHALHADEWMTLAYAKAEAEDFPRMAACLEEAY